MTASWLALGTTWRETHWRGQALRLANVAPSVSRLADQLVDAWPQEDGALAGLGEFSAYPLGRPSTLMLLGSPTLPDSTIPLVAVHRGEDDAVRFQLGGGETGAWLERLPHERGPADFEDGLQSVHRLERSTSLGNGWYAVRYSLSGQ